MKEYYAEYNNRNELILKLTKSTKKLQALTLLNLPKVGEHIKVFTPDVYGFELEVVSVEVDGVIGKDRDDGTMLKAISLIYQSKGYYDGIITDI